MPPTRVFLDGVPNRFLLPAPSAAWERAVWAYDPDLRVFPSQKRPVYRVARVRTLTPILHEKYRQSPQDVHPDSRIALEHNLIFVNWSLKAEAFAEDVDGKLLVATLRRRDTRPLTEKSGTDSDKTAEAIEELERQEEQAKQSAFRDKTRQVGRAARLAVLYRTGQRVSLNIPQRRADSWPAAPAPSLPPATSGSQPTVG